MMNGERCAECEARFPCLPVRLATKLKAAEQVVEAAVTRALDWQETPCFTCQICHRAWNDVEGNPPDHERWCPVPAALAEYDKGVQG